MLHSPEVRRNLWRVPAIALAAGLLYTPCYVRLVVRFGVVRPGEIDDTVSLLTSGGLFLAAFILGGILLLRRQSRAAVFASASLVVLYGLLLLAAQFLTGSTTGPAAVVFLRLSAPLEWMIFPSALDLYLREHAGISLPFLGYLRLFLPWLFVLFGRPAPAGGAAE